MTQAIPSYEQMMPVVLQCIIRSRVSWAKTYLVKAGLLENRIVLIDGARLAGPDDRIWRRRHHAPDPDQQSTGFRLLFGRLKHG